MLIGYPDSFQSKVQDMLDTVTHWGIGKSVAARNRLLTVASDSFRDKKAHLRVQKIVTVISCFVSL